MMNEEMYLLTCEVQVTKFDKDSASAPGKASACGQPAVNGFLCAQHTSIARSVNSEDALAMLYGCGACNKVVVRGFDANGKEYRIVHFNADEEQMADEMRMAYERFLETADINGVQIVRGPYAVWQSVFVCAEDVEHASE